MADKDAQVVAPEPGTPEYDAAMIAKADAAFGTPDEAAKPEGLPEGFDSVEALAKAYQELQAGKATDPAKEEPEAEPEVTPKDATPEDAAQALADVGIDYNALSEEFNTTGALSEESYKTLAEKAGLDRETVDAYIAGQQAVVELTRMKAFDVAGGEKQYEAMSAWAQVSMSKAELQAYNKAVSGTPDEVALAVAGLKAKYIAANGSNPTLLQGGSGPAQNTSGYESRAQLVEAMQDPRYAKDPAYRKSVEQKLAVSNIFG